MNTTRSGLILYCIEKNGDMLVLLGMGAGTGVRLSGLTTIGGRPINESETEIECLVREAYEETRGLLDYSKFPEIFLMNKHIRYDSCFYSFIEVKKSILEKLCSDFTKTSSHRKVCNELLSLELLSSKKLIRDMVESGNEFIYNETFRKMFMDVGFDTLHNNRHNYATEEIGLPINLNVPIDKLPTIISLQTEKNRHMLKNIYGTMKRFKSEITVFLGDQFYYEDTDDDTEEIDSNNEIRKKRYAVFRSGIIHLT
jgi:8-oxo-dGTP pyrophosphatase MutT (NUDIX family)